MQFPKVDKVSLTDGIKIPQMVKVHQHFANVDLDDPVATLNEQLAAMDEATKAGVKGKRIGISAGSRGVPFYKEMMKLLCDYLKEWGAEPFIFPAMGSHANGDAEGQKALLAQFGINEEYLGVRRSFGRSEKTYRAEMQGLSGVQRTRLRQYYPRSRLKRTRQRRQ